MLLLTSTSDIVRLITGAAASTIEVHTSYVDVNGTTITPGRTNTRITTATTTTIVASPAASTQRNGCGRYGQRYRIGSGGCQCSGRRCFGHLELHSHRCSCWRSDLQSGCD